MVQTRRGCARDWGACSRLPIPRLLASRSPPRNAVHVYRLEAFRFARSRAARAASNGLGTPDILRAPPSTTTTPCPTPATVATAPTPLELLPPAPTAAPSRSCSRTASSRWWSLCAAGSRLQTPSAWSPGDGRSRTYGSPMRGGELARHDANFRRMYHTPSSTDSTDRILGRS